MQRYKIFSNKETLLRKIFCLSIIIYGVNPSQTKTTFPVKVVNCTQTKDKRRTAAPPHRRTICKIAIPHQKEGYNILYNIYIIIYILYKYSYKQSNAKK